MTFSTKEISAEYIGVIDIGSSKIRVGICSIKNRHIELLGYAEKRQDKHDIVLQEFKNIPNVCENISLAIQKAEKDAQKNISNIIINLPTPEIFLEFAKINYIREESESSINQDETYKIMKYVEEKALKKHYKNIKNNSGYSQNETSLIISNLSDILLDGQQTNKLEGKTAKEVSLSLSNIFIPQQSYEIAEYIGEYTQKNIIQIIPTEYSLSTLFSHRESVVIIDIGSSHTSLIVKKNGYILGGKKLTFGMNDLIKNIQNNYKLSPVNIIESIDTDNFLREKYEFLEIFKDILSISLSEILGNQICPHEFFMTGGGANSFIKNYLSQINLNIGNLKVSKTIEFVTPKIDILEDVDESWVHKAKTNINIYSMITSTLDFVKKDKSNIERTLKKVIRDIS